MKNLSGLQKICKLYGAIDVKDDRNGQTVRWVWDYAQDKAVLESELTGKRWKISERARWSAEDKARGNSSQLSG